MEVTFHRVSITVSDVDNPKEAYKRLCDALEIFEYNTQTYSVLDTEGRDPAEERDTSELFPT